ncbi:E3 ubiquitin-protein ligase TRIM39 [Xenopus laevis]|uniref:Uncharacterized protein n=2 Tax=Xenopus laevis TaxID=8355 RepID=A0A974H8Z1_XENLA|nr:E3 ubiquitin-protein ligase TRIM39 [Xenopus laevis]OCT68791.1 hypothetical protein XELAEV_18040082mg [Xenopus laevis]
MAAADLSNDLTCSVCLETYRDPVTLLCGHNFCKDCIAKTWQTQKDYLGEDPSCPECRQTYRKEPTLNRNVTLHNIAEQFRPEHTKCSAHNEHLKYYCCEDGACICESCRQFGDHKGHRVEGLNEASEKQKEKLRNVLKKLTPERGETERQVQRLQECKKEVEEKVAGERERVTALFKDISERLKALEKQNLDEISKQGTKLSLPFTDLIQRLDEKKSKLSTKIDNIKYLCNMADPLTFLPAQGSDVAALLCVDSEDYEGRERDGLKVPVVGDLDLDLIPDTLLAGLAKIMTVVKGWRIYGKKATNMLMDLNTTGDNVQVSRDGKSLSYTNTDQHYPPKPERFHISQGLSFTSFSSGRHYWEVEGSESGHWKVGVAYPSIKRNGGESFLGDNKKSWCLCRWENIYSVTHNNEWTHLSHVPTCGRIRISLDYEAGCLSFYELSESVRHLHTFAGTFTESLHAAFWVWGDTWVRIVS